jgi:hypothetical protein
MVGLLDLDEFQHKISVKKASTININSATKQSSPNSTFLKREVCDESLEDFDNCRKISKPTQKLKYYGLKNSQKEGADLGHRNNQQSKSKDFTKKNGFESENSSYTNFKKSKSPSLTFTSNSLAVKSGKFIVKEKDFYSILNDEEELESSGKYLRHNGAKGLNQRSDSKAKPNSFLKGRNYTPSREKPSDPKNPQDSWKTANIGNRNSSFLKDKNIKISEDLERSRSRSMPKNSKVVRVNQENLVEKRSNNLQKNKNNPSRDILRIESELRAEISKSPIRKSSRLNNSSQDLRRQNKQHPEQKVQDCDNSSYRSTNRSHNSANMRKSTASYTSHSKSAKKVIKQFDTDLTFKPMLSKKSMQLAQKLPSAMTRLTQNLYQKEEEDEVTDRNRSNSRPKINKRSEFLDKQKNMEDRPRFERLYQQSKVTQKLTEEQRVRKIEEDLEREMKEVRSRTPTKRRSDSNNNFFTSEVDVSERNLIWKAKKDEKVEKNRNFKDMLASRDCTFKPQIEGSQNSYKKTTQVNPVYSSNFLKDGLKDHFTRIEIAKKNKSYKEINEQKSRKSSPYVKKSSDGISEQYESREQSHNFGASDNQFIFSKNPVYTNRSSNGGNGYQTFEDKPHIPSESNDSVKKSSINAIVANLKRFAK